MTRELIVSLLQRNHDELISLVSSMDENDFLAAANGKWNAGQQLEHIRRSVSPLATGLRLPLLFLGIFFGKANRPSRSYENLVAKYQGELQKGGIATGRFVPRKIAFSERGSIQDKLQCAVQQLCRNINRIDESELDRVILPHPLLGKITIREMCYFTIYHAAHHKKLIEQGTTQPN